MDQKEKLTAYLLSVYEPSAMILYGSFADGTQGPDSDFDALLITDGVRKHDVSQVEGTPLDVFVYPAETFRGAYDPQEFLQTAGGKILLDRDGTAADLIRRVTEYLQKLPEKSNEELLGEVIWCERMAARAKRKDPEGYYRRHFVLTDSLEIYCDLMRIPYSGPKKALKRMRNEDPESYGVYAAALERMDDRSLDAWIGCLRDLLKT